MPDLLDLTIGAVEIGVVLSSVLYGVATVQAYSYAERNFKDPIYIRLLVFFVWLFETIHTAFSYVLLYSLTVTHYGDPREIGRTPWSLSLTVPLSSSIGASVQVFFAWRVRKLGGSLIIPILSWTGAVMRLGFGISIAVLFMRSDTVPDFFAHYQWIVDALLGMNLAVDTINTIALCFYLLRQRSDFKGSQRVIDKLIVYSLETGLLTSICAVAVLACSLSMPDNLVFLGVFLVYSKLFSNSLYASLNARQSLREGRGEVHTNGGTSGVYLDTQLSTLTLGGRPIAIESGLRTVNSIHPTQSSSSLFKGTGKKAEALP